MHALPRHGRRLGDNMHFLAVDPAAAAAVIRASAPPATSARLHLPLRRRSEMLHVCAVDNSRWNPP